MEIIVIDFVFYSSKIWISISTTIILEERTEVLWWYAILSEITSDDIKKTADDSILKRDNQTWWEKINKKQMYNIKIGSYLLKVVDLRLQYFAWKKK